MGDSMGDDGFSGAAEETRRSRLPSRVPSAPKQSIESRIRSHLALTSVVLERGEAMGE